MSEPRRVSHLSPTSENAYGFSLSFLTPGEIVPSITSGLLAVVCLFEFMDFSAQPLQLKKLTCQVAGRPAPL